MVRAANELDRAQVKAKELASQPPVDHNHPVGQVKRITVLTASQYERKDEAMALLKKLATLVAPIMRKHDWTLPTLAEFFPDQKNLLGMNINGGQKILIRLRQPHSPNAFFDLESQLIETMLHELTHNVHGPHDDKFYAFLDKLKDEYHALRQSGYSGEGFLGDGKRLSGSVTVPLWKAKERALAAAEARAATGRLMGAPGGQKLGGAQRPYKPLNEILAEAAERRLRDKVACGHGDMTEEDMKRVEAQASAESEVIWIEPPTAREAAETRVEQRTADAILLSSDDEAEPAPSVSSPPAKPPAERGQWTCEKCTFINPPSAKCEICDAPGPPTLLPGKSRSATLSRPVDLKRIDPKKLLPRERFIPVAVKDPNIYGQDGRWACHICAEMNPSELWCCAACMTVKLNS
ncbi:uncharacterized protein L969DRAFT_50728 [Mixia osmundae IAM 14324]|uniref:WLM domain-containing protein n=1 Tax=Mixia osmundae (strain CBS 9802 / IAM 14324 / JCM 22182 / KY 12970) TaxID=764103 RepID=G7E7H8_MIXOS|nr:uncharacterized protein L969DRAFT_50728 [Mixia osmundae IAM 14324]KEI38391.1 hypothetical protein L969DRAFT_50728 [Mixia osmundae IAM 14324]GAA98788.1 hypothetical protein E5Q_05476 [Mixia osmundae IAM 14324]